MVNNSDIQKFLVSQLLVHAATSGILPDKTEVREDNWHGKVYKYPNIRVQVLSQDVEYEKVCAWSTVTADILINSEEPSSDQSNDIAYSVAKFLHRKNLSDKTVPNNSISNVICTVTTLGGAESVGDIWLVKIGLTLLVTGK